MPTGVDRARAGVSAWASRSARSAAGWTSRLPRSAPADLAIVRIAVGVLLLFTREVRGAAAWADLSPALAVTPRGWAWALALLPPTEAVARTAQLVLFTGAILGTLGCFARAAFAGTTLAALYLLALPLRSGLPYHYQHLVWLAALCAASPCADALSVDHWRRRRRGIPDAVPSAAYGIPIRVSWLLIGAVFFFPGLWKLRASGLGWITSDNLRNQLYWKWATTPGLVPPFRIDRLPVLLHTGAAGVVLFELTFGVAVWWRPLRLPMIVAALLFHLIAWAFMGIDFSALWITYVVFIDWAAVEQRWRGGASATTSIVPPTRRVALRLAPAVLVGGALVLGAVEAGARGVTNGWPFACYPTFQERAGTEMPALVVSLVTRDGGQVLLDWQADVPPPELPRERLFGLGLIARARAPGAEARFAAYWQRLARRPSLQARLDAPGEQQVRAVRFEAAQISIVPDEWSRPATGVRLLYELPLVPGPTPPVPAPEPTMMPRARSGAITWPSSADAAMVK